MKSELPSAVDICPLVGQIDFVPVGGTQNGRRRFGSLLHPSSADRFLEELRHLGLRKARSIGLDHDDAEDCAGEWVLKNLKHALVTSGKEAMPVGGVRYVSVSARNFAIDYRRRIIARRKRELPWPEYLRDDTDGSTPRWDPSDPAPSPEQVCIAQDTESRLLCLLAKLSQRDLNIVVQRVLHDETFADIAEQMGMTPNATRKACLRVCERVREAVIADK